jgi:ABC-type transport system substrate-binding protein
MPGLAERWEVRADDPTKWIFYLRPGVKFHDGTDFNADAVIWNLDKVKNKEAPQVRSWASSASPGVENPPPLACYSASSSQMRVRCISKAWTSSKSLAPR